MKGEVNLSVKELEFVQNTDFLLTRRKINKKVNRLLSKTEESIKYFLQNNHINFPENTKFKAGKIAKGENYRGLPYYILDYPRLFSRNSIFALRTMFWWGHYFVLTFHLSGQALQDLRPALVERVPQRTEAGILLYINEHDPWQHHLSNENYRALDTFAPASLQEKLSRLEHVKLSSTLSLQDWNHLPDFTLDFFRQMLMLVSLYEEST